MMFDWTRSKNPKNECKTLKQENAKNEENGEENGGATPTTMEMEDLAPPSSPPQAIIQHQPFSPPIHESDGEDSDTGTGREKSYFWKYLEN